MHIKWSTPKNYTEVLVFNEVFLYKEEEGPNHSIQMMTISVTASLLSLLSETSADIFPPWCMILHKYTARGSRPNMTLHPRHL